MELVFLNISTNNEIKKKKDKVCIICPEHGEFWQTPITHLRSNGCSKCSGKAKKTTKA